LTDFLHASAVGSVPVWAPLQGISGAGVGKTAAKYWQTQSGVNLEYKQVKCGLFNCKFQNDTW